MRILLFNSNLASPFDKDNKRLLNLRMCFSISSHFYKKIDMNSITVRQLELCNQQKLCFIPIYFNLQVAIGAFDLGQMKNPNYN